jgi:hypothetical protein
MFGDYYDRKGKWLGNDGIDDDKVYVATGKTVKENANGTTTTTFDNAVNLGITHTEFKQIANIVMKEGGSNSPNEYLYIAHATNNAANASGTTFYKKIMSSFSSVQNKSGLSLSPDNISARANYARAGIVDVFSGSSDPTGGASLWDGTDFLAWGLNSPYGNSHAKFRQYNSISISSDIYNAYLSETLNRYPSGKVRYSGTSYDIPASVFHDKSNWSDVGFYYNTGNKNPWSIIAIGAFGHTIFWKTAKKQK